MTYVCPAQANFYRSDQGMVFGVFAGIEERFGLNANVLRLLWLISIFAFGSGLVLYLIAAAVIPKKASLEHFHKRKIFGVCLSLSRRSNMDLGLIRFLSVLFFLLSMGLTATSYVALYFYLKHDRKKICYQSQY